MAKRKIDNYRMVVVQYEPVPLRMSKVHEAIVGGIRATLEQGYNYLVPYFIVLAGRQSYSVDFEMKQQKGDKDTSKLRRQRPTFIVTELEELFENDPDFDPADHHSGQGVYDLIDKCKKITDVEDPAYGLRLGVDSIDYKALKYSESPEGIAEKHAKADAIDKDSSALTNELVSTRLKLKESEDTNTRLMGLMEKMDARLEQLEAKASEKPAPAKRATKAQKAAAAKKKEEEELERELEE